MTAVDVNKFYDEGSASYMNINQLTDKCSFKKAQ